MFGLTSECRLDVDRGPDWLFVHVQRPNSDRLDPIPMADAVWDVVEQHFTYRVVLELGDLPILHSHLIGQLILLGKRISNHGGVLRICGLSAHNQMALAACRLDSNLPNFANRTDAVLGQRAPKPR